ncbi:MAG: tRNA uridine-5-carboxymethylaminomethyl(34) synthesis GTPase MnmE [Gammaproteobacteria bacterium]|nr:tRNA uridine-5-carboxymethylaminomethyl(34) synthesis GTPase MnmE [Gammaproteobacteria bacterium]
MGDTICAIATPHGRGGIGIVRVSGPASAHIGKAVIGRLPTPRKATHARFRSASGDILDEGVALFYPAPASYTGEDVLELQGHGSPVALENLVARVLEFDARLANPGEFTERAFRNDKLDLAQAEAVADLIASGTAEAARAAARSLSGEFSRKLHATDQKILDLRTFVEGAIDFADEEIDFLSDSEAGFHLQQIKDEVATILHQATAGMTMQLGLNVAIAGAPNVGKSSLLNALLGEDRAIVTATAGTTRDTLHGEISLDGLPVRLTDTAGLHESEDPIEIEGMQRARAALDLADWVVWVFDDREESLPLPAAWAAKSIVVRNKCDLSGWDAGQIAPNRFRTSALSGAGLAELQAGLKRVAGFSGGTDAIAGRPRHVAALKRAKSALQHAESELNLGHGELVAENLRLSHDCIGEIVGETSSDDLLGAIFSKFCIGK